MIDNRSNNKNYPLPHPDNIASQDVERIATSISMIDADIVECNSEINEVARSVNALTTTALRIPSEQAGRMNPELQNLSAKKYIVVNADATGFSTVEGGGGGGGKKGEVLAKKSDINFDTIWLDPRSILKQSPVTNEVIDNQQLPNNGLVILKNTVEIDEQLPSRGITPIQTTGNVIADSFCGYILKEEMEDENEDDDIATHEKFGRVKIGSGINVTNGEISVPIIGTATENDFGLVKVGDGFNVSDGVLSTKEYRQADHENYGIVKLSDDFKVGFNGELLLANKTENEGIIYQTANIKPCENNTIIIEENFSVYRLWINEDCMINFDWSLFDQKKDATFDVELYASAAHIIAFNNEIIWAAPCAGVVAGKTVIRFTKRLNLSTLEGDLISQDENVEKLLSVYSEEDITKNYICRTTGANGWTPCSFLVFSRDTYWEYDSLIVPDEDGAIYQMDFLRSTCVTKLFFACGRGSVANFFFIEGSIDGVKWIKLYEIYNTRVAGDWTMELTRRGFFRHYRIRHSSGITMSVLRWYGYDVDDRLFELRRITPRMFSNSQGGYVLTSHAAVNDGALCNITSLWLDNFASFNTTDENNFWWIKYELPEAKVVDFIDIASGNGDTQWNPMWFKIEGSNDDENWTLLLEKGQNKPWNKCQAFQYFIDNSIAYKYYKLTVKSTLNSTSCRVYRWRLYKKEDGVRSMENFLPTMVATSQDGYLVSAESQWDENHAALYAFDGTSNTRWASGGGAPTWLQVQLPTEIVCNAYQITSRNDKYYAQSPRDFRLEGSNDGITWKTLDTETGIVFLQNETKLFDFENDRSYSYYRVYVTESNGGSIDGVFPVAIGKLELGRLLKNYKKDLNVYEHLIPKMNSNSQNGYIASASSEYNNNEGAWRAFDRQGTQWTTVDRQNNNIELKIALPEAQKCDLIMLGISNDDRRKPQTFRIEASNDDENWTVLYQNLEGANLSINSDYYYENPYKDTAFQYYRLYILTNNGEGHISLRAFQLIRHILTREY